MDQEDRWMTRLLEASLQSSGLSEREVEDRLGWEPGTLGRILDGTAECDPLQLLDILAELDEARPGSSSYLLRRERGTQMVQDLIERFQGLGYGQPQAASVSTVSPPMHEIEQTVEEVLRRTFGMDLGKKDKRGGR
jgi:hypothetical protein